MENYNNSDVFGYSSQFSISGMPIDNYEPDDSIKQAKLLVPGSAQEHTLPTGDVDWFSIAGDAGRLYTIGTTGTTDTRMELYNQSGATKLVVDDTSGPGENAKISWYCVQGGTYNLKVFSSYYGPYTIQSSAFDSTEFRFSVSSPVDGDSFTVGDTCTISWNSGVSIGGAVDIFLYNTSGVVSTIQANTSSAGIYRWIIPLALAAASDYRIKIISRTVGDIFGFSNIFTIGK